MTCQEIRDLLSPYADGELDLVRDLEIERHLGECPDCAAALERTRSLSTRLADPALYHEPPAGLRRRVRASLAGAGRGRGRLASLPWGRLGMAAAAAVLVIVAFWGVVRAVSARSAEELLAEDVVNGHVHSLMAEHLLDVKSDDRHRVKPWFIGKVDVAPEVKDLGPDFPLAGGRLDYIHGRPTAALVYRRNLHVINVFVWRTTEKDRCAEYLERQGYHLVSWTDNERAFWVVSDLNQQELREFAELLRR